LYEWYFDSSQKTGSAFMRLVLIQPSLRAGGSEENCEIIESLILSVKSSILSDDVILLPEHFISADDPETYDKFVKHLAVQTGCTIIGGSHRRLLEVKHVNYGSVWNSEGKVIGEYTKLRPYFNENKHVSPGKMLGEVEILGKNFLILICADFWYSDIFFSTKLRPDVVLVPALSVSRKPSPEYSRSLWRNFAIQRAFEFGVYIGISDWRADSYLKEYRTCGVGGFADPTSTDPAKLFTEIGEKGITFFDVETDALENFRNDRKMRGFFWK
jgi:predicted amidohydrolase